MILPDFVLNCTRNKILASTGIDSRDCATDKSWFDSYPYQIEYRYNDRGFRDAAWPDSQQELQNAIWCVGDSFTVGIGSPVEHTWPSVLSRATGTRTINVSMDGASNNWICRKVLRILAEIEPQILVIHWSYIHRREEHIDVALHKRWQTFYAQVKDPSWPDCDYDQRDSLPDWILQELEQVHARIDADAIWDEERRIYTIACSHEDDLDNTLHCIDQVTQTSARTKIIHTFIPNFVPDRFKGHIESQISGLVVPEVTPLDWARDRLHYDILTSGWLVDHIQQRL